MTVYNALMILGALVLVAIVVKGFWGGRRVKAIEQPDNAPSTDGSHSSGGGD
jgi:FtsZ-interacting cell division protein ZipA